MGGVIFLDCALRLRPDNVNYSRTQTASEPVWPMSEPLELPVTRDATPDDEYVERLPRVLGFGAILAVVVGNIIGSGIFRVPSVVADDSEPCAATWSQTA